MRDAWRARAAWAALACAAVSACGWTPADEQVLARFFEQSRLYDRTRLASVSTTVFDPRTDGVVARFEVVSREPDREVDGRVQRDMTLEAVVRSPAGNEHERTLHVTLEDVDGRWIVTRVR